MTLEWKKWKLDFTRLGFLAGLAFVSYELATLCAPLLEKDWETVRLIVLIFGFLAGFLIFAMTMIAASGLERKPEWAFLVLNRKTVEARLMRYALVFTFYIVTLGLALAVQFTKEVPAEEIEWLRVMFLGFSFFLLAISCSLPFTMIMIQMEKYEEKVEQERPPALKHAIDIKAARNSQ